MSATLAQSAQDRTGTQLWDDFVRFCHIQLESGDYDPVYPVLRALELGLPGERVSFSFRYLAFYHLPSALLARSVVKPEDWGTLPTGIERRNLRGGRVRTHWEDLVERCRAGNGWRNWLLAGAQAGRTEQQRQDSWALVFGRLQEPWGNGRWAAYKGAELLQLVHDWPLEPPDMGHAHSSGPRKGLGLFVRALPTSNSTRVIATLDGLSRQLLARVRSHGLAITMGQAETMLCNFHSLVHGDYYPGHDIDLMAGQAELLRCYPELYDQLMAARAAALPRAWLGEYGGWHGVDKARKTAYRDHGTLVTR